MVGMRGKCYSTYMEKSKTIKYRPIDLILIKIVAIPLGGFLIFGVSVVLLSMIGASMEIGLDQLLVPILCLSGFLLYYVVWLFTALSTTPAIEIQDKGLMFHFIFRKLFIECENLEIHEVKSILRNGTYIVSSFLPKQFYITSLFKFRPKKTMQIYGFGKRKKEFIKLVQQNIELHQNSSSNSA